jgi:catechol 2,3-dioxygenase-like lactoylglutathione lyase family enzyme
VETIIADLVRRFENGGLSRRQLIRGLSLLAAAGGASDASAQPSGIRAMNIGHVSVQVTDVQRSIDFYAKTFGLTINGEDKPNKIARLGITGTLVSLHQIPPTGLVDHFAINVESFNKARVTQELKQRGIEPRETLDAGFHIKDPDGVNVQIT